MLSVRQLETYGSSGLLLEKLGAGKNMISVRDIIDTHPHQVTAAQLTVDSQVEEGKIAFTASDL
jgi:hypothetical protein